MPWKDVYHESFFTSNENQKQQFKILESPRAIAFNWGWLIIKIIGNI